jgi:monoamine oxidase
MHEIAIIGGGLSGLALANSLSLAGCQVSVFEARERIGGRVRTIELENGGWADLGPTWFWPAQQRRMAGLVRHLGLPTVDQYEAGVHRMQRESGAEPQDVEQAGLHAGAMRLVDGMGALTDALAARLVQKDIHLEHTLKQVTDHGTHVSLLFATPDGEVQVTAATVVIALPPRLIEEAIHFDPPLSADTRMTMRETPTWMAGQAKLATALPSAFWREAGQSGSAVAPYHGAVLAETWDASDDRGHAALGAFIGLDPAQRESFRNGLPMLAASQLVQFFGLPAAGAECHVQDWATEPFTCSRLDRMEAPEHPANVSETLQMPFWQGRMHFGASETAAYAPGYLEGALEAAGRVHKALTRFLSRAA